MNIKKHGIEFFGTFVFTLAILTSLLVGGGVSTPIMAGIALGLLAYALGPFACVHLNPAITAAFVVFKKMDIREAGFHVLAQFAGAALALALVRLSVSAPIAPTSIAFLEFNWSVLIAELVGTFLFAFGVASFVFRKIPSDSSDETTTDISPSLILGAFLVLGIMTAGGLGSNGIINPAVAFGLSSLSLVYLLAPVAGAILGMWLYLCISGEKYGPAPVQESLDLAN